MPGFAVTLADVNTTAPIIPPLPAGVPEPVFSFFFGSPSVGINRAINAAPFVNIGTGPVYSADQATFTPYTAALKTPVECIHTGMTFLAVWKRVTGGTGAYHRIFSGNPQSLPVPSFAQLAANGQLELSGTNPAGTATLAISGSLDSYRFIAGALGDNLPTTIYNMTDGTESTNGPASTVLYSIPGSFIELCSGTAAGPTKPSGLVWSGIVTQRLSQPQILAYHQAIRAMAELTPAIAGIPF